MFQAGGRPVKAVSRSEAAGMVVALFDIVRCFFPDPLVAAILDIDDICWRTTAGGWPRRLGSPKVGTLPVGVTRMNNVEHQPLNLVRARVMFEQLESSDREAMTSIARQHQAVLLEPTVYAGEASYSATGP